MQDVAGREATKSPQEALASLMEKVQSSEYVTRNIGRIRLATTREINAALKGAKKEMLRTVGLAHKYKELVKALEEAGLLEMLEPYDEVAGFLP